MSDDQLEQQPHKEDEKEEQHQQQQPEEEGEGQEKEEDGEERKGSSGATKTVLPGIEGGSSPPKSEESGILGTITGFFKSFAKEMAMASQDLVDQRDSKLSSEGEESLLRVETFRELSTDYRRLQKMAQELTRALELAAAGHRDLAVELEAEAKVFADHSSTTEGLEDGVVSDNLRLDSPKTGMEASQLCEAGALQRGLADACLQLKMTVETFSESINLFNDKVLADLDASVKIYRQNRRLLDSMERTSFDKEEVKRLQEETQNSRERVDVKLALLREKRFKDLTSISHSLRAALRQFVVGSRSITE